MVDDPIKNRIKSRFLSFGGRLVLLKYVLTSLPVYALSFFKDPLECWQLGTGSREGVCEGGGSSGSSWWREIVSIRDGVDGVGGGWFRECLLKRVGDKTETFFWTDHWLGGTPLCEQFGRLFDLAVNKSSTVAKMHSLGWDIGGEVWEWRRQLWAWEKEMLGECQTLLLDIILQAHTPYMWIWHLDPVRGYSVRGAYQLLTSQPS
ncbi:hypothetical protein TSUD_351040 [Trifolium subterraneum]|uniref:Reverse transcriptase zinc-binding domain-containing protein n=1 Tax=Trifolium subterraneum TaxID=3900 RepID=A0A2Z6NYY6_TRISU|nr:hypothetical protein TSUD_351040 [Trifolium subterraneum]